MELIDEQRLIASLKPGHVVHTLVKEHERILNFLDALEETNAAIQKMAAYDRARPEFKKLRRVAEHLVGAEPHHRREEEVLFPQLEMRGFRGPPQVMRMEHDELRKWKKEIMALAAKPGETGFGEFKARLNNAVQAVVLMLRDHIHKENNILYPMALQAISDEKTWGAMRAECDKIGYCCFTPGGKP